MKQLDLFRVEVDGHEVQLSDVPAELQDIAGQLGLYVFIEMLQLRGGEYVYFPKLASLLLRARDREIRAKFNGINYRELARKYRLSVARVRAIINTD